MSNEPNLVLPALSVVEGSEVEWIHQITHFINEQQKMPALSSVEGNNKQIVKRTQFTSK